MLHKAYDFPFRIQSDYARYNADAVALAASLGYITVVLADGQPTKEWRVTDEGMFQLKLIRNREDGIRN